MFNKIKGISRRKGKNAEKSSKNKAKTEDGKARQMTSMLQSETSEKSRKKTKEKATQRIGSEETSQTPTAKLMAPMTPNETVVKMIDAGLFDDDDKAKNANKKISKEKANDGTVRKKIDIYNLQPGSIFVKWKIHSLLGRGAFGVVYKATFSADNTTCALKIEDRNKPGQTLKMEIYVLSQVNIVKAEHYCKMIDAAGSSEMGVNILAMSLVGKNLGDLRIENKKPKHMFTMGCALSVGMQCLEAIQELHYVGFLHRDVKPGNFCIGHDNPKHIYLIDLGMCRRYLDNNGKVRWPRWSAAFKGTVRYASVNCHIFRDICRKDDIESLLYMLVELTNGRLPWKYVGDDPVIVGYMKQICRTTGMNTLFAMCPREYIHILFYLDAVSYYEEPDYAIVRGLLRDALVNNNLKEHPYDWV